MNDYNPPYNRDDMTWHEITLFWWILPEKCVYVFPHPVFGNDIFVCLSGWSRSRNFVSLIGTVQYWSWCVDGLGNALPCLAFALLCVMIPMFFTTS